MKIISVNPYNEEKLQEYQLYDQDQVENFLSKAQSQFLLWKEVSLSKRTKLLMKMAKALEKNKEKYGLLMTQEVGKPISQSIAEIEKCVWLCEFYAKSG